MEGEGKEQGRHGLVDGGQQRGVVLEDELVMGRRRTKKVSGATLRSSQAGAGRRMARLGGAGHAGRRREGNRAEAARSGGGELGRARRSCGS